MSRQSVCKPLLRDSEAAIGQEGMSRRMDWRNLALPTASGLSLIICLVVTLLVSFSLYPGWLFFDSTKQWEWARQIAEQGIPQHLQDYRITSHWPIFNTLMKVPFYRLTGEVGLYALTQAFFFNLSIYLVGCAVIGRRSGWLVVYTLAMVLSPVAVNYSVFHSSDTIVAACALVCIAMICDDAPGLTRRAVSLGAAALLMSLVRYNALPAAILLTVLFFWITKPTFGARRALLLGCATIVLVIASVAGMRAYEHTAIMRDSVAGGIAIRLLDASRHTSDPVVHAVIDPNVRGNLALQQPLAPSCYAHGMWCSQFAVPWRNLPNDQYLHAYFHLLIHHPLVFTQVNARFASYALGFASPLEPTQIGRADIGAPFPSARMVYTHRRKMLLRALRRELQALDGFVARSGMVLALGLLAALLLRRFRLVVALAALAIGYLGPLLLLVGTNNYRYTLPVTIVAMAIIAGACCVGLMHGQRLLRRKFFATA